MGHPQRCDRRFVAANFRDCHYALVVVVGLYSYPFILHEPKDEPHVQRNISQHLFDICTRILHGLQDVVDASHLILYEIRLCYSVFQIDRQRIENRGTEVGVTHRRLSVIVPTSIQLLIRRRWFF